MKLFLEERDGLLPACPACRAERDRRRFRPRRDAAGRRAAYCRSACHVVLGASQDRSPWTGV